jgi:hypothetical protein
MGEGSFDIGEVGGDRDSDVDWLSAGWLIFSRGISSAKIWLIRWANSSASRC